MAETLKRVPVAQLAVRKGFNERFDYGDIKGLADSIKANGIKVPLRVREVEVKGKVEYQITDGHRRFQAIELLKDAKLQVPVIVEEANYTDKQRYIDMLLTNDGKNLNLLEQSNIMQKLKDEGLKDADIAKKTGKSQTHVADCLLLQGASAALKKQMQSGKIAPSTVIEMIKSEGAEETEKAVKKTTEANPSKKKVTAKDVEKATGKAVTAKGKKSAQSAGKSTKADPVKEKKETKEADESLNRLKKLQDVLNDQTEVTKKEDAFGLLGDVIKWLEGDLEANDLSGYFFKDTYQEDEEEEELDD